MRRRESTGGRDGFVQAGDIVDGEVDFIDCRPLGSPERGHRDEDSAPGARPDRAGKELVPADQATGVWVVGVRLWEARTNSRYERMMRAAETAGDQDRLSDWEFRAEQARERRHRRRMDWLAAPFALAQALAAAAVTILGMLLGLGVVLAVAHSDITWVLVPFGAVVDLVAWTVWLATVVWWFPLVLAAPWVLAALLWQVGRAHGRLPEWAAPASAREEVSVIVTPGVVAAALAHLGIPALNRAVKQGWRVEFSTPPVRVNGRGYQTVFSLPMGVTPDMVADKRDVLARNLHRTPLEVWPAGAEHAGYTSTCGWPIAGRRRSQPHRTRCCMTGLRTCSPVSRWGCRSVVTSSVPRYRAGTWCSAG